MLKPLAFQHNCLLSKISTIKEASSILIVFPASSRVGMILVNLITQKALDHSNDLVIEY